MEVNVNEIADNSGPIPNADYNARSSSEMSAGGNSFNRRDIMPDAQIHFEHQEQCVADSERPECSENKDPSNQMSHRHRLSSSERSNTVGEDQSYVAPPKVNCQEKIVSISVTMNILFCCLSQLGLKHRNLTFSW